MIDNDLLQRITELEVRTASMIPACERIFHFRTKEMSNGGVTLVFNQEKGTGLVAIGLSVCSSKDNFNKSKGVSLATENQYIFGKIHRSLKNMPKSSAYDLLLKLVQKNKHPKLARQMLAVYKLNLS